MTETESVLISVLERLLMAADTMAVSYHIGGPKVLAVNDIEIPVSREEAAAVSRLMAMDL